VQQLVLGDEETKAPVKGKEGGEGHFDVRKKVQFISVHNGIEVRLIDALEGGEDREDEKTIVVKNARDVRRHELFRRYASFLQIISFLLIRQFRYVFWGCCLGLSGLAFCASCTTTLAKPIRRRRRLQLGADLAF